MPLQISLGIGVKVLNTIEEQTVSLYNQIKAEDRQQTGEINEIMRNLEILTTDILDKNEKLQQISDNREVKTLNLNNFGKQHIEMLEKVSNGKSHCDKSAEAKKVQQYHNEQDREIKASDKSEIEKETEVTQKYFESLQKQFIEKRGFYQTKFCNVKDELKLQRQVYHSGALVGNNVNKLTKTENILKISDVFKPSVIELTDNSYKEFSSYEQVVKIRTLLMEFKQYY